MDPVAVQVVDGIGADDGVEGGGFDGHLAHVARLDGGAPIDTGGLQVEEQPFASLIGRRFTFSGSAEMAHVFVAEPIQCHHERTRPGFQNH